jgi:hypothetical protein
MHSLLHIYFLFFQDFVHELGEMETIKDTSIPKKYVTMEDCNLNDITKYELSFDQLSSYSDLVHRKKYLFLSFFYF